MSLQLTLVSKPTGVAPFGCYGSPSTGDSCYDASYVKHSIAPALVPLDKNYASTGIKQAAYFRSDSPTVGVPITLDGKVGEYAVTNLQPALVNGHYVLQGIWFVNNGPANVPAGGTPNASTPWVGYIDPGNVAGPLAASGSGGTFDPKPLLDRIAQLESEVAEQYRRLGVDDTRFTTDEAEITALQNGTTPPTPPVNGKNTLITAPGYEGGILLRNVTPDQLTIVSST